MPEFYTWTILLINQLGEIGEKQLSVFGSRGGQICPLMHVPLSVAVSNESGDIHRAKMAMSMSFDERVILNSVLTP